jgi:hypothetical protein
LRGQNIVIAQDIIKNALANKNLTLRGGEGNGRVVVESDFEVTGRSIGTAPYVTGVLYVTVDGDDHNDGLAEDRAKRTISSAAAVAANMIRYRGWVYATIFVRSGVYLEPNPITVHSGISIVGDNLRSVTVRPQNPYADILWLNPKTYVTGITFRGHRHPAAVAQFPENGVSVIHDLHDWTSPYVQNCSSITLGAYDTVGGILYQAGTGMIVDGKRGRKLSDSSQSNVTVARFDGIIGDDTLYVLKDIAPTLGSQIFPQAGDQPGWMLQSGVAGTPSNVIAVGDTVINGADAWTVQVDALIMGSVLVTHWDNVITDSSVVVLDSTSPNLDQTLAGGWILTDPGLTSAQTLLAANKTFIQAETIAYINSAFPDFVYDQALSYRDAGTILDCLISDMLDGSRERSTAAGKAFWRGQTSVINSEMHECQNAIEYIKSMCLRIVNNELVSPPYQDGVVQKVYPSLTGGAIATSQLTTCVAVINNLISLGADADLFGNASHLLMANRAFIQEEFVSYLTARFPVFQFDSTRMKETVDSIVTMINKDILNGGHGGAVSAGLEQYLDLASYLGGEERPITEAIGYIKFVAINAISNISVPKPYQTAVGQHVDQTLDGGCTASKTVSDAFDIVINIIQNGPSIAPYSENISTGYSSAYQLMMLNRAFIQAEVVAFVNDAYPSFQYDQTKCFRDVGLIIDYLGQDVYWGGNENATYAGRAYWNGAINAVQGEIIQTVAAIEHARQMVAAIVKNEEVTPVYQNSYYQTYNYGLGEGAIARPRVDNAFGTISNIISNGPAASAPVPGLGDARQLLVKNLQFMQAETIAYIAYLYPAFSYDTTKCRRDVAYIIGCISTDLVNGTYTESLAAGKAYWNGATSLIPGERPETVAAINYIRDMALQIVTNTPIPDPYQGTVVQQVDYELDNGAMAIPMIQQNMDLIANIINGGLAVATRDQGYTDAGAITGLNNDFLVAETMAYMNVHYPVLVFDRNEIAGEFDAMVHATRSDLVSGGWAAVLAFARSYYDGSTLRIKSRQGETLAAMAYMASIAQSVITNTPVASSLQTQVSQTINYTYDGSIASDQLSAMYQLVSDVVNRGDNTYSMVAHGYVSATTLLSDNLAFIGAKAVSYVTANYPTLIYDHNEFSSRMQAMISALCGDLLSTDDYQCKVFGLSYWKGNSPTVPTSLLTATADAITYINSISLYIINNDLVVDPYVVTVPQVTNYSFSDGAVAREACYELLTYVYNMVSNGPNNQRPIYLNGSVSVNSILSTEYQGQPAWIINFSDPLGGLIFGPFNLQSWSGPDVLVPPENIRPYQGQGLSSFVLDAFTQYNEIAGDGLDAGGNGIVIKNGGYAQLVSIFEICCNIGVLCQSGGTCSITNSNTDFGNYGLWADGVSELQYSCNVVGGGQGPSSFLISGLPEYTDGSNRYKRPYVGQVITISKYLADFDYTAQQFYYIETVAIDDGGLGYDPAFPPTVHIKSPSVYSGGFQAQATSNLVMDDTSGLYYVGSVTLVVSGNMFTMDQLLDPEFITFDPPPEGGAQAYAHAVGYPIYYTLTESTEPNIDGYCVISIDERLPYTPDDNSVINFYQVSRIIASSHCFEYIGTGTDIARCIPARGGVPIQEKEVVTSNGGRVAYTSTDHLGNFRIGDELVINQNTGTLSGRTFVKSLFAIMTPYLLAIEGS